MFYGADERARILADQWVFWQMGGLGPMAGQTHHFRQYAPSMFIDSRATAYGAIRYTNETHRLYGVLNKQLEGRDFITGEYSIADMASWPLDRAVSKPGDRHRRVYQPEGLVRTGGRAGGGAGGL